MLEPSGYSLEEAEAVVGKQIVRVFEKANGARMDGRIGRIEAAEQVPHFHGNNYQYFVSVRWINRDGTQSMPHRMSKEQIEQHTRPLRVQEIAQAQHKARQIRSSATQQRTKRRGFRM